MKTPLASHNSRSHILLHSAHTLYDQATTQCEPESRQSLVLQLKEICIAGIRVCQEQNDRAGHDEFFFLLRDAERLALNREMLDNDRPTMEEQSISKELHVHDLAALEGSFGTDDLTYLGDVTLSKTRPNVGTISDGIVKMTRKEARKLRHSQYQDLSAKFEQLRLTDLGNRQLRISKKTSRKLLKLKARITAFEKARAQSSLDSGKTHFDIEEWIRERKAAALGNLIKREKQEYDTGCLIKQEPSC